MDANISPVEAGDKQFNLEWKEMEEEEGAEKGSTKEMVRPNSNFLQQ